MKTPEISIEVLTSALSIRDIIEAVRGSPYYYIFEDSRRTYVHFHGTYGSTVITQRDTQVYPNNPFVVDMDDPEKASRTEGYKIILRDKDQNEHLRFLKRDTGVPFLVINNNRIFIRSGYLSVEYFEQPMGSLKILRVIE